MQTYHFKFFCDVETTGFCPYRNDIVSMAMIVTDKNLKMVGKFYETCQPDFNKFYSEKSEQIHGFNKKMLESFQPRRTFLISLLKFLKPFKDPNNFTQDFIYHGRNRFDFRFLEESFRKEWIHSIYRIFSPNQVFSTLEMAKNTYNLQNYKLNTICEHLGIDLKHHDALSDTLACMEIYKKCINLELINSERLSLPVTDLKKATKE